MKIAKMDKRILLQKPVTQEDGYGGLETVFEDAGKAWAKMERTDYAEQQAEGTPMNREQVRLRIRPRKDIQRPPTTPSGITRCSSCGTMNRGCELWRRLP